MLYDRYISLSQQKATEMNIKKIRKFHKDKRFEMNEILDYIKFLHSKSKQIYACIQNKRQECLIKLTS